jgi:hypothetical protein
MVQFNAFWRWSGRAHKGPFTLLAGTSSSGKSTYFRPFRDRPHLFAHQAKRLGELPDGGVLHYNTLRFCRRDPALLGADFRNDGLMRRLCATDRPFDTTFVFCDRSTLLQRIAQRQTIEWGQGYYDSGAYFALVEQIDYPAFQERWLAFLRDISRSVTLLHSDEDRFRVVDQAAFRQIVSA